MGIACRLWIAGNGWYLFSSILQPSIHYVACPATARTAAVHRGRSRPEVGTLRVPFDAFHKAAAGAKAGDTICLLDGTYEPIRCDIALNGVTITSAVHSGSGDFGHCRIRTTFDDPKKAAMTLVGATAVIVQGIHFSAPVGLALENCTNVVVRDCAFQVWRAAVLQSPHNNPNTRTGVAFSSAGGGANNLHHNNRIERLAPRRVTFRDSVPFPRGCLALGAHLAVAFVLTGLVLWLGSFRLPITVDEMRLVFVMAFSSVAFDFVLFQPSKQLALYLKTKWR